MITVLKQNFKTKMIQNKNQPHTQVYTQGLNLSLQMYSEGSPAVKQSNETAFSYFKKAADKVITVVEFFVRFSQKS